jgi:transcription elongation factor Elf1
MDTLDHTFECPYCGAQISMLLDLSAEVQQYIEDCEVCCNPIEVVIRVRDDAVVAFEARSIEQ